MLLYFGSKSMMPAASSLVCESAHTRSIFAQATNRTYVRGAGGPRTSPLRPHHRGVAVEDRRRDALGDLGAREANLLVQQRRLAVRHVAVG